MNDKYYMQSILKKYNEKEPDLTVEIIRKICSWEFNDIGRKIIYEDLNTIGLFYSAFISYIQITNNESAVALYEKIRKKVREAYYEKLK
jgi:hypothetical protein